MAQISKTAASISINKFRRGYPYLAILALFVLTSPIFFDIYRIAAFNAVPHDDYAHYLLALVGDPEGYLPQSPYIYRILSVAAAMPFFYSLPLYTFSNLQGQVSISFLRAVQALSAVSYISIILTSLVIFTLVKKRFAKTDATAGIAALLSIFLSGFLSRPGIDPLVVLAIALIYLFIDKPWIFTPLIFLSIGINEKILFIFLTMTAFRSLNSLINKQKPDYLIQLLASCLSLIVYFWVVFSLEIPGHDRQLNPSLYLQHAYNTFTYTFSIKGIFLNGIPILLVAALSYLGQKYPSQSKIRVVDSACFIAILIVAWVTDLQYTVGRVVMHTYPLYLPAAMCLIDQRLFTVPNKIQNTV